MNSKRHLHSIVLTALLLANAPGSQAGANVIAPEARPSGVYPRCEILLTEAQVPASFWERTKAWFTPAPTFEFDHIEIFLAQLAETAPALRLRAFKKSLETIPSLSVSDAAKLIAIFRPVDQLAVFRLLEKQIVPEAAPALDAIAQEVFWPVIAEVRGPLARIAHRPANEAEWAATTSSPAQQVEIEAFLEKFIANEGTHLRLHQALGLVNRVKSSPTRDRILQTLVTSKRRDFAPDDLLLFLQRIESNKARRAAIMEYFELETETIEAELAADLLRIVRSKQTRNEILTRFVPRNAVRLRGAKMILLFELISDSDLKDMLIEHFIASNIRYLYADQVVVLLREMSSREQIGLIVETYLLHNAGRISKSYVSSLIDLVKSRSKRNELRAKFGV